MTYVAIRGREVPLRQTALYRAANDHPLRAPAPANDPDGPEAA